ncbi:MAG: 3' terminal RNA ribose 2'-O-methyltransferase Hen1, partial [Gammaproteobacteria bacterium]|nr:3' terminal RNA ribose 2'-O-methyltransferase Hen1 [Gammaproteobacteria bacterium]
MLLTISTTHQPATDLGFLLHKHPDKVQTFPVSIGKAHVYYPEANEQRCTVALQLEVDPIGLVRSFKGGRRQKLLEHYVNDRPYVASSFLSVALNKVFRSAFTGTGSHQQQIADTEIPL